MEHLIPDHWFAGQPQWVLLAIAAIAVYVLGRGADWLVDGGTYCNTCHDRTSMVSKDNCYACHRHGDGGRW